MTEETRPLSTPHPTEQPDETGQQIPDTTSVAPPGTTSPSLRERLRTRAFGWKSLLATALVSVALGGVAGAGIHAAADDSDGHAPRGRGWSESEGPGRGGDGPRRGPWGSDRDGGQQWNRQPGPGQQGNGQQGSGQQGNDQSDQSPSPAPEGQQSPDAGTDS